MSLNSAQCAFIESVVSLRPQLAVFDCDGTLWRGDSGAGFFYWELDAGLIPPEVASWARARYDEYKAGRVSEEQMCGEMVTMNAGVSEEAIARAACDFFEQRVAANIFPEMLELTTRLRAGGSELWAVSSTCAWVVEVGVERFGIPAERVVAASVLIERGVATGTLVRVPSGAGKAAALREVVGRPADAVFGNSVHDLAMLEMARHPFCINPNRDLSALAAERRWPVYWPAGTAAV
jgi:phosphoserine phosphatase